MQISKAEFDEKTGAPILKGRISISEGPEAANFQVPVHDRLLLVINPDGFARNSVFAIWPVTSKERCASGFYSCNIAVPILFLPLKLQDIHLFGGRKGEKHSFLYAGKDSGTITNSLTPTIGNRYGQTTHHFTQFKVEGGYEKEGLFIEITGRFAIGAKSANEVQENDAPAPDIRVEMLFSWEQLAFIGFGHTSGAERDSGPSRDIPEHARDSRALEDILVSEGLHWPVLRGKLDTRPAERKTKYLPSEIRLLSITNIGHDVLSAFDDVWHISDASRAQLLSSGFVQTMGSHYYLSITALRHQFLEQIFRSKDSFSMSLSGDGLGSLRYETPGGWFGHADPRRWIYQTPKTLTLNAMLNENGLEITANAELNDFEPGMVEERIQERNKAILPYTHFDLQMILPWALLVVRGFSFAGKASNFCDK